MIFTGGDRLRFSMRFVGLVLHIVVWKRRWHLPIISDFATAHDLDSSPCLTWRGDIGGWWTPP